MEANPIDIGLAVFDGAGAEERTRYPLPAGSHTSSAETTTSKGTPSASKCRLQLKLLVLCDVSGAQVDLVCFLSIAHDL